MTSTPRLSAATPAPARSAAAEAHQTLRLGPSLFGHRSLSEELVGVAEERAAGGSKTPRPGVGTRAVTDPTVVTSPRALATPRTLVSPRVFTQPRGTTTIRAVER